MLSDSPTWSDTGARSIDIVKRTIVLWELLRQGKLDVGYGTKGPLAEALGVTRHTLGRNIAAIDEAQSDVDRILRQLDPTYLQQQAEQSKLARQLYASRHIPGTFLDEDEYEQALKDAGLVA